MSLSCAVDVRGLPLTAEILILGDDGLDCPSEELCFFSKGLTFGESLLEGLDSPSEGLCFLKGLKFGDSLLEGLDFPSEGLCLGIKFGDSLPEELISGDCPDSEERHEGLTSTSGDFRGLTSTGDVNASSSSPSSLRFSKELYLKLRFPGRFDLTNAKGGLPMRSGEHASPPNSLSWTSSGSLFPIPSSLDRESAEIGRRDKVVTLLLLNRDSSNSSLCREHTATRFSRLRLTRIGPIIMKNSNSKGGV